MPRKDLKDYKHNQLWIKGRLEYIEAYKASIINISAVLSDMPRGSREIEDSIAEKIAILLDTTNELFSEILKENKKQKVILNQLTKVEQPYRLILEKVYIEGKSLVAASNEMNYSYRNITRLHRIALNKFDEICGRFDK